MGDVVNLRLARKAKGRALKAQQAEANRAFHGENKAARSVRKADAERSRRNLDGHQLDRD